MFYVAVPVSVIEKPGVFASLSRSAKLTGRGSRWQILGLVLLVVVIGAVCSVITRPLGAPASSGNC